MKILMYTVCAGANKYHAMSKMALETLRRVGYDGEVVVICDKDYEFDDSLNVTKQISQRDNLDVEHKVIKEKNESKLLKMKIGDFYDLKEYDLIVYFDSDTLFFKHPEEFISTLDKNKIHFHRHRRRICTCLVIFDPKKFENLMSEWEEETRSNFIGKDFFDQPAMRIVLAEKKYAHAIIDRKYVSQNGYTNGCYLAHYLCRRFGMMVHHYKNYLTMDKSKQVESDETAKLQINKEN